MSNPTYSIAFKSNSLTFPVCLLYETTSKSVINLTKTLPLYHFLRVVFYNYMLYDIFCTYVRSYILYCF